jgi:hypothetical protein
MADDAKEVAGLRVALGAEHADEAFGLGAGGGAELFEADGGLDVVPQEGFAGFGDLG